MDGAKRQGWSRSVADVVGSLVSVTFRDITGLFSRYFITGFFLPSLFALLALSVGLDERWLPAIFEQLRPTTKTIVVIGLAVLAGLLLLGLRTPIIRLFEGYPIESLGRRGGRRGAARRAWTDKLPRTLRPSRWPHSLYSYMHGREQQRFSRLRSLSEDGDVRARRELDRSFPGMVERLPTRLGNVIRAYEYYADSRWGLDSFTAWPRIAALLSDRERDLHVEAETDFIFLLMGSLAAYVTGVTLLADALVHRPLVASDLWSVVPLPLGYGLYRLSLEAARRWGAEVRASVDLHRLEFYERVGLKRPRSPKEEKEMATELGVFLATGGELSEKWWQPETPTSSAT